ncbi:hypothetical protein LTR85_006360 [Meristemomyces frigidus]|nr:hypothetical protein LTR85_006360 [Meristemomyces frigidus]
METNEEPHLLSLPRELRNYIYDCTTVSVELSPPQPAAEPERPLTQWGHPTIFTKTTDPTLLRVCHQIHDEYRERVLPRSELAITLVSCDMFDLPDLQLKAGVPAELLQMPRKILIAFNWVNVLPMSMLQRHKEWFDTHTPEQLRHQELLAWTPTKALFQKLKDFLALLKRYISSSATVELLVMIDGLPDPHDPYAVGPLDVNRSTSGEMAELMGHMFHKDTINELSKDATLPWPRLPIEGGNLRVRFALITALNYTLAENSAELLANRKARLAGETEEVVWPVCETSKEVVNWRLQPTPCENNFRGYWPTVKSIMVCQSGLRIGG